MPEDLLKDSITKTYGIRSGEPKRPESLIEIPGMVPEVPEVSLCFNQENTQPLQSNKALPFEVAARDVDHQQHRHHVCEMLHRNNYESYNTWKAKNSQALHNITGGLERTDLGSKRACSAKRSAGLARKQNSGNEIFPQYMIPQKYPTNGSLEQVKSTKVNSGTESHSPQFNAKLQTSNQSNNIYPAEHQRIGRNNQFLPQSVRDSQITEEIFKNPSNPASNIQNHYGCKDRVIEQMPYTYRMSDKSNHIGNPVCVPSQCNKYQCSCVKQNAHVNSLSGNHFFNENPILTNELRGNMQLLDTTKIYSPLEYGMINNHLNNLSHIINIQKEQITMLCQEINSQKMIMSALLEEVKQIHAKVSPPTQVNGNPPQTEKKPCQCCNCEHKNHQDIMNKKSEDSGSSPVKHDETLANKTTSVSPYNVEKRSVGVMTSSLENSAKSAVRSNGKDKPQGVKGVHQVQNQDKKSKHFNSSPNKNKQANKKEQRSNQMEKKKTSPHHLAHKGKNKKEEFYESSQSEDSFSLDEAAVVVPNETEQGDVSPEVSIHVNMPDYSASSDESDTSNSFNSEEEGQESGSEGESSDPQIGWTFYDRVVGQVNNMLKKTSKDPRQEYTHTRGKTAGNVLHQCNEDYEAENNWSKRVTFDGPPLEDSDNNGMHMPRYHHFRANQDYRIPGPERVQDFLMCDYANGGNNLSLVNGSTNVSFATYRYYQRHQLLPPTPEQAFPDITQKRKNDKSRKSEKTNTVPQKNQKRRSGQPSSKILDVSALKHQPKLF